MALTMRLPEKPAGSSSSTCIKWLEEKLIIAREMFTVEASHYGIVHASTTSMYTTQVYVIDMQILWRGPTRLFFFFFFY